MTKGKFRKETSAAQQKRRTILQTYLTSLVSLVLCVTMFFGTTAAWFTDTVETNQNQMMVGTLKVQLDHASYKEGKLGDYEDVTQNNHKVFTTDTKWEPGYTAVEKFRLTELGSLAFGYKLNITLGDATVLDQATYKAFTEAISVWNYSGTDASGYQLPADFDAIAAPNSGWNKVGTLYDVLSNQLTVFSGSMDYKKVQEEKAAVEHIIALHMDEECDGVVGTNETIQGLTLDKIKITLVATQMSSENDAFGSDYDAAPGADKWDGEEAKPEDAPADEDNDGVIAINTADELAGFAAAVNAGTSYSGKTIVLASDIDLGNKAWTPIGAADSKAYFQGTFDGQGHTIYGLNVDKSTDDYKYSTAGFFGWIDAAAATIKNVKFANATVKGSHWVGVVAGYMTGEISNCSVTNSTVIGFNVNDDANGDKVGGIVGYVNSGSGKLDGNTVSDSAITGYRDVAGLAGAVATTNAVKNNTVKNVTVTYEADHGAEIVTKKTEVVVDATNKAVNVTLIKGKLVAEGVYETATKTYQVYGKEGLLNVNTIIANSSTGEGQGVKVTLMTDVNLSGETWKPIDKMWVDFDGNGHTISNLKAEGWKAGFFGYLGGGSIKNLTLENVDVTGAQVAAFAGAMEGTIDNCTLKGTNTITWAEKHQYDDPNSAIEAWNGIGAITGITQPCTVNATIAEGATVTLNYGDMTTEAEYVDELTGYIGTNKGVVTNSGTIIVKKNASVSNETELTAAINEGASDITLAAGTYKMPSVSGSKRFTIKGTKDTVIDLTMGAYMDSSKVSFEGVTIKGSTGKANGNGSDYAALYTPNVTYTNCTFDGPFRIGRDGATFINCTFTNLGNDYVWTYGNDATFEGCTFNTDGKAILVYSDGGSEVSQVSVKNCVFNSTQGAKAGAIANQNCAAIEIHNYGNGVNLTTSGNTYDSNFSGEWRIKTYEDGKPKIFVNGTEYTTIAIDGKTMTIDADKNVTVND